MNLSNSVDAPCDIQLTVYLVVKISIDWEELQQAIVNRLGNVLDQYVERNKDCNEEDYQEPNVDKFDMEASRAEIMSLISSFTDPPFTIQRICELLLSPFFYYDKISTFLRGLEKNLRVVSSNDWSKSQVYSRSEVDIIFPVRTSEFHKPPEPTKDDDNIEEGPQPATDD